MRDDYWSRNPHKRTNNINYSRDISSIQLKHILTWCSNVIFQREGKGVFLTARRSNSTHRRVSGQRGEGGKRGRGWKPTAKRSTIKSHSVSPLSPWKNEYVRVCACILYACACVRVVRVLICAKLGVRRRTTESYSEVTCAFYRRDAAWLDSANNCNNTVKPRGLLTPN